MNTNCYADHFNRFGKNYLRCFADGAIVRIGKKLPDVCPHCHRPLDAVVCENPDKYLEVKIQIDLPHYKRLANRLQRKYEKETPR